MVVDKALTIRAAEGVNPTIRLDAAAAETGEPLLKASARLKLLGLTLERESTMDWHADQVLLQIDKAPLYVKNCRFLLKRKLDCIRAINSPECRIENSEFVSNGGNAISWPPPANGNLLMRNCLVVGQRAVHLHYRYVDIDGISVELDHNTFVTPDLPKEGEPSRGVAVKVFTEQIAHADTAEYPAGGLRSGAFPARIRGRLGGNQHQVIHITFTVR
jgi:hypothetical protein